MSLELSVSLGSEALNLEAYRYGDEIFWGFEIIRAVARRRLHLVSMEQLSACADSAIPQTPLRT